MKNNLNWITALVSSIFMTLLASCDLGTAIPAGEEFPGAKWQRQTPEEVEIIMLVSKTIQ